jgi:competence protein ComFC
MLTHKLCCDDCRPEDTEFRWRCKICFTPLLTPERRSTCYVCECFPSSFRYLRYLWKYDTKTMDFISTFKYKPSLALCRLAANQLVASLQRLDFPMDWDLIAPIPVSRENLRKRQFNQAAVIARAIQAKARSNGRELPLISLSSSKIKLPQARLAHEQRFKNVRDAFALPKSPGLTGKKILLIDDVQTTGVSVDLLVLTRSPAWQRYRVVNRPKSNSK